MRTYLKNEIHLGDNWSLADALEEECPSRRSQLSPPLEDKDYLPSPIVLPEPPLTYLQAIQNMTRLQNQAKKEAAALEEKRVKFCF